MCDHCSKLTMWKWSLNLKVGRKVSSPLDYSKRYEHELKVITSTIQYSQGPWYNTVQVQCIIIMSSIPRHSNTSTHVQGESERSELTPCIIYKIIINNISIYIICIILLYR